MRTQNMKPEKYWSYEKSGSFTETKTTVRFVLLPVTEQNLIEDRLKTTGLLSDQFLQSVSRGRSEGFFFFLSYKYVPCNSHCGRLLNPCMDP